MENAALYMMGRECLLKLGPNEVEEGMEGTNQALESSPPLPQERDLTGRKRGVYKCTPMCASARVAPSNIVYL